MTNMHTGNTQAVYVQRGLLYLILHVVEISRKTFATLEMCILHFAVSAWEGCGR